MKNKLALVIGGARGIGYRISSNLLNNKFKVFIIDKSKKNLKACSEKLKDNKSVHFLNFDLLDPHFISIELDNLIKKHGCPTVFVNNIRYRSESALDELSNWNNGLNLGLTIPYFISKKIIDVSKNPVNILHISSIASKLITNESSLYHVIKSGINSLTRYTAIYGAKKGCRTNAILPGLVIQDDHRQHYLSDENREFRSMAEYYQPSSIPGSEQDIADIAMYLLSDKSKFLNGQSITADGGASIQDQFSLLLNANKRKTI